MECRCNVADELYGSEAETYATEHLHRDETDSDRLKERYSCPDTGARWVLDWPEAREEDPGQARLRLEQ